MTATLKGGEWSAARPGGTLPPGKSRYPFYRRLVRPQGRSGRAENLVPIGIRSRTVQPVFSRYTDWATQPTSIINANTFMVLLQRSFFYQYHYLTNRPWRFCNVTILLWLVLLCKDIIKIYIQVRCCHRHHLIAFPLCGYTIVQRVRAFCSNCSFLAYKLH